MFDNEEEQSRMEYFRQFSMMMDMREGEQSKLEDKSKTKRVDHMIRQPKATPIKRLFELNRIADYSHSHSAAVQTEKNSSNRAPPVRRMFKDTDQTLTGEHSKWKSVNFDLDEVERKRSGPLLTKAATPSKRLHASLHQILAQQKNKLINKKYFKPVKLSKNRINLRC